MARYTGPVCRFCRREGQKLFLKGERCYTDKCSIERRNYPPGQHGNSRRSKLSEYGGQLREKQKVRRVYGMMERPFRNLFQYAASKRAGVTSEVFFQNLEMRLDNVVYRMGLGRSRNESRQLVRHNHIFVNGKKNNIPSSKIKVGDEISVSPKSAKLASFELAAELYKRRPAIQWLEIDHGKLTGKILALPSRDDVQLNVKERLIVELYSK